VPGAQAGAWDVARSAGGLRRKLGRDAVVGDQIDDVQAAFHAGCRRVLVRTGLGNKTLADKLPDYVTPFAVHADLAEAVQALLRT
jgi:phosphoglycolate phosphatase-like HAD superfamily hydrolase